MNVLIIGAGYVGRAAAKAWRAHGHFVTLTTRRLERAAELSQEADRVVVIESGNFKAALENQQIVLLCMAPGHPSSDADYEKTYLETAKAVLRDQDKSCEQIIYTSSTSVYGEHGGAIVDEETPLRPESHREQILVETEKKLLGAPCKVCILRLGEIVGPGRQIVDRLRSLNGRPLAGTGANICNISPIVEIVQALLVASEQGWQGVYNICSDQHPTRRELYEKLCVEAQIPPVSWDATRTSPHAGNKCVSSEKYLKKRKVSTFCS